MSSQVRVRRHNLPLAISPGDRDGIGPEVTAKALAQFVSDRDPPRVVIFGNKSVLLASGISENSSTHIHDITSPLPGTEAGMAIEMAAQAVMHGECSALVTGPISKERLIAGGFAFSGHTDFLAALATRPKSTLRGLSSRKIGTLRPKPVTMMLANDKLRVSLVTVHCPLREVSKRVTPEALSRALLQTVASLQTDFGIPVPRVAVLGLNPHAGENGILGTEERKVLDPTISRLSRRLKGRALISGPFPADTYFALHHHDAVIAMFHDQGLIPVKMADFDNTVNLTLGLPFVRTSVDHGTAFDIAGKNQANPASMVAAIRQALRMVKNREISKRSL